MKKLIFLFLLFLLLVPLTAVWAQGPVAFDFPEAETGNITEYIDSFYKTAVAIAGIAAVAMIVVGAIYFVVSGGSQDKQREGKDIITSAVWGVVLLLGAYIILNTINPELVTLSPPAGKSLTQYSCEEYPDIRVCEIGERPIEVEDPPDPDAVPQCCVLGLGHDGSAEQKTCSQEIMDACASPVAWSNDIKIPKCRDKSLERCHIKWNWLFWSKKNPEPADGSGIYYRWVYYPENTDPSAAGIPQTEEPKCIVYSYKISVEDEEFITPGFFGLRKCY